jgi:hypothetical protein
MLQAAAKNRRRRILQFAEGLEDFNLGRAAFVGGLRLHHESVECRDQFQRQLRGLPLPGDARGFGRHQIHFAVETLGCFGASLRRRRLAA